MINSYLHPEWQAASARWRRSLDVHSDARDKADKGVSADTPERQIAALRRELKLEPTLASEEQTAREARLEQWLGFGQERVIGNASFEPGNFLEVGLAVGRAVCLVEVRDLMGKRISCGTGFMVSPTVMITNNHVLPTPDHAKRTFITFDHRIDPYGRPMAGTIFRLDPDTLFFTDKECDCTLVHVGPRESGNQEVRNFGWLPLVGAEGKIKIGDPVNIIQHPKGEAMQWVVRENRLLALPDVPGAGDPRRFAHYEADTLPGSSGAPAMSRMWEVIALHHQAVPATNDKGEVLDHQGQPYHGTDESKVKWIGNEGVRVSALVRLFTARVQDMRGREAQAMNSVLQAQRPDHVALALKARGYVPTRENVIVPSAQPGQRVELTIPLRITVTVGVPEYAGGAAPSDAQPMRVVTPQPLPQSEGGLSAALRELAASAARPYLDKANIAADSAAYYAAFSLHEDRARNFADLAELLDATHKNKPRYKPATQLYPWIDLHQHEGKLVIKSIYSGQIADAADFIREAFAIEAARTLRQDELSFSEQAFSMDEAAFDALLEAELPYNCEHVVPQSWFSKREPMRGDLHHLFACESRCNSFRSNHAFFDFDETEARMDHCGRQEQSRFEPLSGKGAVARATLYFLLRYPAGMDLDRSQMDKSRVATLLRWHEEEPVTDYERHRNQAIFEVQGNRNPLIDHPEWAGRISFEHGLTHHETDSTSIFIES